MELIYCFLDIEIDGPTPGENSMLSLGFAAFDEDEREVGVFETNLETLEGACGAENVMRWWRTHPETWAYIRRTPVPPAVGMKHCLDWLEGLGPDLVLAAHPLLMDGVWLDWYLRRFCDAAVFSGPFRARCPFVGAGVDVPSYVQAALNMEYFTARPDYPPELLRNVPHTHRPIDDARGRARPRRRSSSRESPGAGHVDFAAGQLACESSCRSRRHRAPRVAEDCSAAAGPSCGYPPVYHCAATCAAPPDRARNGNVTFVGEAFTIRSFERVTRVALQGRAR